MVQMGKHYYYKNNEYEVVDFIKAKVEDRWEEFIAYKKVAPDGKKLSKTDQRIYSRNCDDFDDKFIPTTLSDGVKVIGMNMGKVIGIYNFDECLPTVSDNSVPAVRYKSNNGKKLTLYPNVNQDGSLVKIYDEMGIEGTEYFVLSNVKERELHHQEVETKVVSKLNELARMITEKKIVASTEKLLKIDEVVNKLLSEE